MSLRVLGLCRRLVRVGFVGLAIGGLATIAPPATTTSRASDATAQTATATNTAATATNKAATVTPQHRWSWPVVPPWRIVAQFRAPSTRYAAGHRGVDIAAEPGAPVFAPDAGMVTFSGQVVDRSVITILHGNGIRSTIEPVADGLLAGTNVNSGQQIGAVGRGGHCDAVCVHLSARKQQEYLSPMLFLGGIEPAVLLPLGRSASESG